MRYKNAAEYETERMNRLADHIAHALDDGYCCHTALHGTTCDYCGTVFKTFEDAMAASAEAMRKLPRF